MSGAELVSVVVPTYRSHRTIEACLRSIRSQTHPRVEVVVVDNHSDDGTWELAVPLADLALRAGPERSRQRNLGVQASSGTWILYVDADMVLMPGVVAESVAAAHRAGADAVFIPEETVGEGFWAACRRLERSCYEGEERIEAPRLVRRHRLLELGGFDEALVGQEDADLRERLRAAGLVTTHGPARILHDEGRLQPVDVMRKRFYYGRTIAGYRRTHAGAVGRQARATLSAYWRHRRRLASHPLLTAGIATLRGFELGAYLAGSVSAGLDRGERFG